MIDSVRSTYNNLDGLLSSHSSLANKRETSNRSGVDGFDTTSNNGSDMNKPRNFPIITVSAADELFKKDYSIILTKCYDIISLYVFFIFFIVYVFLLMVKLYIKYISISMV